MKKRFAILLALAISTSVIFAACGDSSDSTASTYDYATESASADAGGFDSKLGSFYAESEEGAVEEPASFDDNSTGEGGEEIEYDTSRKIIYNSNIDIETKKFDDDVAAIKQLVASNGGYFESSSINGTAEYGGRNAYYTVRVPSKNYQAFMDSIGSIGSVTYSGENVEDITSNYVDVQARLKSLNRKLKRLEELEENADNIEDLLAIEDRINNVQYDIENYTAQLKVYDDKVDYCTVSITLDEVVTYSEVKKDTAWNRFAEAFAGSFSGFLSFLQWLIIALIYILPYALVAGVILIIVWIATKKTRAAHKEKREKEAEVLKNQSKQLKGDYSGPVYTASTSENKEDTKK